MSVLSKVLKVGEGKKLRRVAELVPLVNNLEPEMEKLDDSALAHSTVELRERLDRGESLDDLLIEAFAVVREAAWRVIGQRHFDVQIMGGMALHFGWVAEMKTGEGKTLVSTLPVYLNALSGRGVHVVTVNEYLAKRDEEWMGSIYRWLGLSVGLVNSSNSDDTAAKREAYASDITYGTNTELGFDYLRDNMARSRDMMVQRGHVYAIVDEVDSILIDEARTPLIISGPSEESARLYYQFAGVARMLKRDQDYEVDEEYRLVSLTEEGIERVERHLGVENLYDMVAVNYVRHLTQALTAKEIYARDDDYIVVNGEVKIVDDFTGRVLEGRRWSDGIHQAIEAKERVRIKEENHTWATVTLQNYFRLYEKLAGMTGTATTEASELASTYNLPVVPIPTHRPMIRVDHPDAIYKTEQAKFQAVVEDIRERYEKGQPVLVGTASVERSEMLSALLDRAGIPHSVLNAKQHAREASIIAQAGRLHAVTVATNMAGRGVDILLGGNPTGLARDEMLAQGLDLDDEGAAEVFEKLKERFTEECAAEGEKVRELGGLYVLGSERHESRRIDDQLRGRAGRQGDPGSSRFFLSLEDELMRLFATGALNWVMDKALPEDVPIEARMVTRAIEKAQHTVEEKNAEVRKQLLKFDEVMNEQRKVIYERRMQIIDGEDLVERTEQLLEDTIVALVQRACPRDFPEEWNLQQLLLEVSQYYPTKFTAEDLEPATTAAHLAESLVAEALEYYHARDTTIPGGPDTAREIERDVMLQIINQRWQEHLVEIDHLNDGMNLRSMGGQDPLVAFQSEAFTLFGQLMDSIDDDYLRYVMHIEVLAKSLDEPDFSQFEYQAASDPVEGSASIAHALAAQAVDASSSPSLAPGGNGTGDPNAGNSADPANAIQAPTVLAEREKIGRNEPCWCGSGRKFKLCHGSR